VASARAFGDLIQRDIRKPKAKSDYCAYCALGMRATAESAKKRALLERLQQAQPQTHTLLQQIDDVIQSMKELEARVALYQQHQQRCAHQRNKFKDMTTRYLKENENECVLIMDFKENISLNLEQVQVGRDFYGRPQRTCFGVVMMCYEEDELRKVQFDVFSKSLAHTGTFAVSALKLVMSHQTFSSKNFEKVHVWQDNAKHFKNQEMLYHLRSLVEATPTLQGITLNFFGENHGKSLCDVRFSAISRALKSYVMSNPERRIGSLEDVCHAVRTYDYSNNLIRREKGEPLVESVQLIFDFPAASSLQYTVLPLLGVASFYSFSFCRRLRSVVRAYSLTGQASSVMVPYASAAQRRRKHEKNSGREDTDVRETTRKQWRALENCQQNIEAARERAQEQTRRRRARLRQRREAREAANANLPEAQTVQVEPDPNAPGSTDSQQQQQPLDSSSRKRSRQEMTSLEEDGDADVELRYALRAKRKKTNEIPSGNELHALSRPRRSHSETIRNSVQPTGGVCDIALGTRRAWIIVNVVSARRLTRGGLQVGRVRCIPL
jgi:hypothetical protein